MSQLRANIIYPDNGQGLSRDARILRRVLAARGCRVTLTPRCPRRPPLDVRYTIEHVVHAGRLVRDRATAALAMAGGRRRWDLNVLLESFDAGCLGLARINWFLPNQEWLDPEQRANLGEVDRVLFKTRHAERQLGELAWRGVYVGFTSEDRFDREVVRDWCRAVHVAGWNPLKGTSRLLKLWSRQSAWPHLTAVAMFQQAPGVPGIELLSKRVPDARLRRLQNACGIHVAPSEVEGFGHSLNEALSCGAILIATDAPPMNELAPRDAAVFVASEPAAPMASGFRYRFSEAAFIDAVERVAGMTEAERRRLGAAAREAYEQGRREFERRFMEALGEV